MEIILPVADHEQNGFVQLARWSGFSEADARAVLGDIDSGITPEQAPDIRTAPFTFVLDLMDGCRSMIANNERCLPMQVAMRLAPEQVAVWLNSRPDPDSVAGRAPPTLPSSRLTAR